MARGSYSPQEVTNAEVIEVRTKDKFPGQRREYNYVVRVNTVDVETGQPVMVNEYRSIASNSELSSSSVLNRMIDLIEEAL